MPCWFLLVGWDLFGCSVVPVYAILMCCTNCERDRTLYLCLARFVAMCGELVGVALCGELVCWCGIMQ